MTVKIEFLKAIPYFSGLSDSEIDSVGKHIFEKKADRGEILSFEGEPADVLYFVVAGAFKVFKTSADGKEQIFRIIRPGDSFRFKRYAESHQRRSHGRGGSQCNQEE